MSPWQPPPRTTRTRLPALGNTPFLHFWWSCSLRPPLPLHSGRPLLILFVTTPSRCRMCGWLNWPMIVASRRKFHHWPSGDVSFRVLMATVLQSWPGILRFPRYTSPNSPGWKEHKVMARCTVIPLLPGDRQQFPPVPQFFFFSGPPGMPLLGQGPGCAPWGRGRESETGVHLCNPFSTVCRVSTVLGSQ